MFIDKHHTKIVGRPFYSYTSSCRDQQESRLGQQDIRKGNCCGQLEGVGEWWAASLVFLHESWTAFFFLFLFRGWAGVIYHDTSKYPVGYNDRERGFVFFWHSVKIRNSHIIPFHTDGNYERTW